jgi:hypothetical protein
MLAGTVAGDATIVFENLGIFVAGLVGCGQVLVLFVIVRAARTLPPLDSLHLHQWMLSTDYPDLYIQPAGILTFVFAVVLLFIEPLTTANVVLTIIPMVAIATIIVLTRTINRPINRKLGTWSDADVDQYPPLRRRWDRSHFCRMICGLSAFASYIILANH